MNPGGWKRLALKCSALAVLTAALLLFSKDSTKALLAPPSAAQEDAHLPTVVGVESEGAPLRIVNTFVEVRGQDGIVIRVMLQNQSAKKIRALAVTADTRTQFLNLSGAASVLLPTQIRIVDISYVLEGLPKRVSVFVDFVEFDDGTTWGTDISNSKDRLTGQRAGAKAERLRLRNLFKSKGRVTLEEIQGEDHQSPPPTTVGRSETWLEGYRGGVSSMRHRIRQALLAGNPAQTEAELNKAFDTAESGKP